MIMALANGEYLFVKDNILTLFDEVAKGFTILAISSHIEKKICAIWQDINHIGEWFNDLLRVVMAILPFFRIGSAPVNRVNDQLWKKDHQIENSDQDQCLCYFHFNFYDNNAHFQIVRNF